MRCTRREQQQRSHRPGDVAWVDAGEDRQVARLDQREDPEVQRAADRHQDAGEHARHGRTRRSKYSGTVITRASRRR